MFFFETRCIYLSISPRTRTVTYGSKAFAVSRPTCWNLLPSSLKSSTCRPTVALDFSWNLEVPLLCDASRIPRFYNDRLSPLTSLNIQSNRTAKLNPDNGLLGVLLVDARWSPIPVLTGPDVQ